MSKTEINLCSFILVQMCLKCTLARMELLSKGNFFSFLILLQQLCIQYNIFVNRVSVVNFISIEILFSAVQEGSLLIDSSTINPEVAKEVALRAEEKGAIYLDAPVSGGECKLHVVLLDT